ncbi:tumor necrosis factor receptor superfamily member 19L isoform X2 [Ambystoma mexicanum]|uniref:tumor necrosis factor receptor superfamily member 19L isoform X2 n=1 Tax=Ambystoma mexicanum TaxID=8296 RepID=UPI0037E86D0D
MSRSPWSGPRLALTVLATLLLWHGAFLLECGEQEYQTEAGQCAACSICPAGEEADRACGFGKGVGVTCRPCPAGFFSDASGTGPCLPHTQCETVKKVRVHRGTATVDSQCGDCMPGFYAPAGEAGAVAECLPCHRAPPNTAGCEGFRALPDRPQRSANTMVKRETKVAINGTQAGGLEESGTEYAVLAIVPVFCLMGLLGILLCNLLKKKGYHCTSQKQLDEESTLAAEKAGNNPTYGVEDANEDTIGVLVRLITEKKENAVALEELLKDYHSKQIVATSSSKPPSKMQFLPQVPHICSHQHHLHTVQGSASRSGSSCTRCSQKKWPELLLSPETAAAMAAMPVKPPKPVTKAGRPGEITILSVGRFRVARIPEQRQSQNPTEVKTITESGGQDVTEPAPSLPAEQKTLLGNGVKTKWLKPADNKQEDVA